jgi:hypothetical protein
VTCWTAGHSSSQLYFPFSCFAPHTLVILKAEPVDSLAFGSRIVDGQEALLAVLTDAVAASRTPP